MNLTKDDNGQWWPEIRMWIKWRWNSLWISSGCILHFMLIVPRIILQLWIGWDDWVTEGAVPTFRFRCWFNYWKISNFCWAIQKFFDWCRCFMLMENLLAILRKWYESRRKCIPEISGLWDGEPGKSGLKEIIHCVFYSKQPTRLGLHEKMGFYCGKSYDIPSYTYVQDRIVVRLTLCVPTACAPSYTYKWSLQSNCSISKRNINLCSIECVWNVITQFRFLSFLEESVAPSIFLYSCCKKWVLQIESMWSETRERKEGEKLD